MTRKILCTLATCAATIVGPAAILAAPPTWWQDRGIISSGAAASDYSPATQGQLKAMAFEALRQAAVNETQLGAATDDNGDMTVAYRSILNAQNSPNFSMATIGQAKQLAKPLYDEFLGGTWSATGNPASDYSPLSLGQLKRLFQFDVPRRVLPDENRNWLGTDPGNPWQLPLEPNANNTDTNAYEREFSQSLGAIPFLTPANYPGNRNLLAGEILFSSQAGEQLRTALAAAVPSATWRVVPGYNVPASDELRYFMDIYFDTPDRQLFHNSESLRIRMRFNANNTLAAYPRLMNFLTNPPVSRPWSRLELQSKIKFRAVAAGPSLPGLTFPSELNPGDLNGYFEIIQGRAEYGDSTVFNNGQYSARNLHVFANRVQRGTYLNTADAPPQITSLALQLEPYRNILKARLGTNSSTAKLSLMPEAILITPRGRFHLEANLGSGTQDVFIITVDHTFVYDPFEFMAWCRNPSTPPPEPKLNFVEVETQIEDDRGENFFGGAASDAIFHNYILDLVTLTHLVSNQFPMTVNGLNTGSTAPRTQQKFQTACQVLYPQLH